MQAKKDGPNDKRDDVMRIAGVINDSVVDGEGIRLTVFFQGCGHHCEGCHNEGTWDFNGGIDRSVNDIIQIYKDNPLLDGITLSGGDPVYQHEEALELAKAIHDLGGNVWLYTGFLFEEILRICPLLVQEVDVIIDGPFIKEKRDLTLQFRGSSNQRILRKGKDY